jgi:ubiquinol-cytochrome c reductase cytochrome c1 subunit
VRELFILAIIVVLTSVTYYFIEPFAHSEMHKEVPSAHFAYADLPKLDPKGDAAKGKALVMGAGACTGCHSIEAAGIKATMTPDMAAKSYGVMPPDLSNAGILYSPKFLAAYIADPVRAMKLEHKFGPKTGRTFPMPKFYGAGGNIKQELADMVAYFQSIAVKKDKFTPKMAFDEACGRCHSMRYEKWTPLGTTPKFKTEKAKLTHDLKVIDYKDSLKGYLGSLPPDLSMYIKSRGEEFISTFVENPQNYLKGTAMPRVGLSSFGAKKVIDYLEESGDPVKAEQMSLGKYVMIYFVIFVLFAYLWKRSIWKDLH